MMNAYTKTASELINVTCMHCCKVNCKMFTLYCYMRNWEIRDFYEAQETCKKLSKFPVEMLTALLKTTWNYFKKKKQNCMKNPTY